MVERRESVRLDISGNYKSELAEAAAGFALLRHEADRLNGQRIDVNTAAASRGLRSLSADARSADRDLSKTSVSTRRLGSEVDSLSGRLGLAAEAAVTLGPALLPLGSVGVAAVAGLSTELGVAAAAAGVTAIAFHGVGAALTAVQAAKLAPTVENLQKLHDAMADLGPQGRQLVTTIDGLSGEWTKLQSASQAGLPGVTSALSDLEKRAPEVDRIAQTISTTLGRLVQEGGQSLAGSKWDDFFSFLESDAEPTLVAMGRAAGNVTHALAELVIAGRPLNDSFSGWLVTATKRLDVWASGLSKTQGYQDFLDYVSKEGPEVARTVGDIADALVKVVTAAGPLSGVSLKAIDTLAKLLAGLAGSPIGPALFTAAAGLLAVNRALKITQALGEQNLFSRLAPEVAGLGSSAKTTAAQVRAAEAETGRFARTAGVLNSAGARGAVGLGAMALAGTHAGHSLLGTTAAAAGLGFAIGGPWGAAIGGAGGLLVGFAEDAKKAAAAQDGLSSSMKGTDFSSFNRDLAQAIKAQQQAAAVNRQLLQQNTYSSVPLADGSKPQVSRADTQVALGQVALQGVTQIASAMGAPNQLGEYGDLTGQISISMADLQKAAAAAGPALRAYGLNLADLSHMDPGQQKYWAEVIADYTAAADVATRTTGVFGKSLQAEALTAVRTSHGVNNLVSAISAYTQPTLAAEAANDAFYTSTQQLSKGLSDKSGFTGWSKAALQNRAATEQWSTALQANLTAQAANGASVGKIAGDLEKSRSGFIREGEAAGLSRKQLEARLRVMGDTPKLIRTVFESKGIDLADKVVQQYKAHMDKLPAKVQTDIETNGVPTSTAAIEALQRKYKLTPAQVKTIVSLANGAALAGVGAVNRALASIPRSVNTTITTTHRTVNAGGGSGGKGAYNPAAATGGLITGPGTPTSDSIPAWLSNGEFVMKAAAVKHYGLDAMFRMNAMRLAGGGSAGGNRAIRRADRQFDLSGTADIRSELRDFAEAVKQAGRHLGKNFGELSKQAIGLGKTYAGEQTRLQDLQQKESDLRSAAAGSYAHDAFSGDIQQYRLQEAADRNDAKAMSAALAKAKANGVSGAVLAQLSQSSNLSLAQQFASESRSQAIADSRLYAQRVAADNQLGQTAVVVSGLSGQVTTLVKQMTATTKAMDRLESKIEASVERGAEKGTRAGTDKTNKARNAASTVRAATGRTR